MKPKSKNITSKKFSLGNSLYGIRKHSTVGNSPKHKIHDLQQTYTQISPNKIKKTKDIHNHSSSINSKRPGMNQSLKINRLIQKLKNKTPPSNVTKKQNYLHKSVNSGKKDYHSFRGEIISDSLQQTPDIPAFSVTQKDSPNNFEDFEIQPKFEKAYSQEDDDEEEDASLGQLLRKQSGNTNQDVDGHFMPDSFRYDDDEDQQNSSDFLIDDEDMREIRSQKTELKGFQTAVNKMSIALDLSPHKYLQKNGQFTKAYWNLNQKITGFCDSFQNGKKPGSPERKLSLENTLFVIQRARGMFPDQKNLIHFKSLFDTIDKNKIGLLPRDIVTLVIAAEDNITEDEVMAILGSSFQSSPVRRICSSKEGIDSLRLIFSTNTNKKSMAEISPFSKEETSQFLPFKTDRSISKQDGFISNRHKQQIKSPFLTQKEGIMNTFDSRKKSPTLKDLPEKLRRNLKLSSKRHHESMNYFKKKKESTQTNEFDPSVQNVPNVNELDQFKDDVISEVDAIIDNYIGKFDKIEQLEERVHLLELGKDYNGGGNDYCDDDKRKKNEKNQNREILLKNEFQTNSNKSTQSKIMDALYKARFALGTPILYS